MIAPSPALARVTQKAPAVPIQAPLGQFLAQINWRNDTSFGADQVQRHDSAVVANVMELPWSAFVGVVNWSNLPAVAASLRSEDESAAAAEFELENLMGQFAWD